MTYPDGEILTYGYNTGGLLNSLTSNRSSYISAIAYDLFEQRTSITYGNGVVTNYATIRRAT